MIIQLLENEILLSPGNRDHPKQQKISRRHVTRDYYWNFKLVCRSGGNVLGT